MIKIMVLIDVKNFVAFREYETKTVIIMKQYGGKMLSAFEPNENESIEANCSEVHYLEFPDLDSFKRYRRDIKLVEMSALRETAISKIKIIVSGKFKSYAK